MVCVLGCGACGSADGGSSRLLSVAELCNGSSDIRFAYQQVVDAGLLLEGTGLLFENGASFMVVNGRCEYWTLPGAAAFDDYRTGTLDETQARQLIESTRLGEWEGANGLVWDRTVPDAGVLKFSDGQSWVAVSSHEFEGEGPELARALWNFRKDALPAIQQSSRPVEGPVRYRVFQRESAGEVPTAVWPLSVPLDTVTEDAAALSKNDAGSGRLVEDEVEATKLRELRRAYVADRPYGFPLAYTFLPIGDGTLSVPSHWLFVRDTTPFEAEDGLIAWPWKENAE